MHLIQDLSLLFEIISSYMYIYILSASQVQNAVEYLKMIGALDDKENLTVLGRYHFLLLMYIV